MNRSILLVGLGFAFFQATPQAAPQVIVDTAEWRRARENDLTGERGWLSVSGLPWLKEGENSVGSGDGNAVRVADGPRVWGVVVRTGTLVELRPAEGRTRPIAPADPPFQIGRTWVQVIQRSERIGLRLWDPLNARKLAFLGLKWYGIRPEYKVQGRLIPSPSPAAVRIANVIGQVIEYPSPGVVEFELFGRRYELTPVFETPERNELFYIFKDSTAGKTTYGAGRFLYSALPDAEGRVVLDFNRAYSPPCAFTDFATCPVPPAQNRIDVAIEAGELDPHSGR